ncbi:MAG: hypothetical protein KDD25_10305, partial [Bdellovibrionales bacterium]|nr:hypothetical protein [Bdellovibrionales bacterium]
KHTNFVVKNVLKEEEVKNVAFSVSGAETETVLVIEDHAVQADLLEDSIHMRIKRDKVFSNPEVFNGDVPADLITVEDGKIIVAIGKLPVSDKDTFKKGKKIKVFTDLTRSFAGHSTTIGSLEHYEIPKK